MSQLHPPPDAEIPLGKWNLVDQFRRILEGAVKNKQLHPSFEDPDRRLKHSDYLCLFLFGLFNPAIRSMRALCKASVWQKVQEKVCAGKVSLGSFSEAQHLVDPAHLQEVFGELSNKIQGPMPSDPRLAWRQWFARDSSLFSALPRMTWAIYGGGRSGCPNKAIRLHLDLHVLKDAPSSAQITPGKECERKVWKENWKKGAGYVGDRYFGKNFRLFALLNHTGCSYVIRLVEEATVNILEEIPITQADRDAGVVRQAWVTLGKEEYRSVRVRLVWIEGKDTALMLVTNVPPERLSADLVGLLYRRRWQIECFFRWLKCLLKCRHWMAESENGVAIQLYLALICAVLLQQTLGNRPNQRSWELIQMFHLGWVTPQELVNGLQQEEAAAARRKNRK